MNIIIYFCLLFFNIFLYNTVPQRLDQTYMTICLVIAILSISVFCYSSKYGRWNIQKIYLRHSMYFIICYFIVFYQCDIDYILGFSDIEDEYLWYGGTTAVKAMTLSNIGLLGIMLGYSYGQLSEKVCIRVRKPHKYPNKKILNWLAVFLLLIYIIFVPREFLSNGYTRGVEAGPINTIMSYIISVFVAIITLYSIEIKQQKSLSWFKEMRIPIIIITAYIALILLTGRRTEAIRIAVTLLISYLYCRSWEINYKKIALLCLVGLSIFSLVGIYRSLESSSVEDGIQTVKDTYSIMPFTRELANSVNTLHITMFYYPDKIDYTYGETFFPGFLKIIPGLSYLYEQLFVPNGVDISSDMIISKLYFGRDVIWGLGSSVNADIYMAFGPIGIFVILCFLGYFLRYLERETFCKDCSAYVLALSFGCYSQFIYCCRQSIPILFLCWTYSCLLIFFVSRNKTPMT